MTSAAEHTFQFIGGDLCFDFCNTVGGKRGVRTREYFVSYADFLSWCRQAGLLSQADVDALLRKASHQPDAATAVLNRATELREAIYRIFAALIEDKTPQSADIARLNRELSHSLNRLRVVRQGDSYAWQWEPKGDELDQALGPIARSAAELLTEGEFAGHARRCEGDNCGWLFLDATKNGKRRWCSMEDCGSNVKALEYYYRKKKEKKG